ncbi:MAG: helix-turn-helix domain-containing protein [Planctomycetales bacterium]|jgi:excisionase family DNA binding protein
MSDKKLAEAAEQIAAEEAEKAAAAPPKPEKPKRTIHWDDELMTTRQLMEFLSLSRTKIWELVNKEQLPAFKIGGDYRYRRTEVIVWLEKYRVKRG